jgi:hypothetical protein
VIHHFGDIQQPGVDTTVVATYVVLKHMYASHVTTGSSWREFLPSSHSTAGRQGA